MFTHERPVRFEDIDAAQIVFFPRVIIYCHETLELFLNQLDGGHSGLITKRRIGLPAVHLDMEFKKPLRYGDSVNIQLEVTKIGRSSVGLRYTVVRVGDGELIAVINHVCVLSAIEELRSVPIPADVRALLEQHLVPA
ncbi:MAG: thioesterase family protein [Polyangiaceae bacterium]